MRSGTVRGLSQLTNVLQADVAAFAVSVPAAPALATRASVAAAATILLFMDMTGSSPHAARAATRRNVSQIPVPVAGLATLVR